MTVWKVLREALAACVRNPILGILHLLGNAILFGAFVLWLRISEAHWWSLAGSFILILAVVLSTLVLHGGTIYHYLRVHGREEDEVVHLDVFSFERAFRNTLAIVIWIAVFVLLWRQIGRLTASPFPSFFRSELPEWLRRNWSDSGVTSTWRVLADLLRWILLPGLALPLLCTVIDKGFRGFVSIRVWRRMLTSGAYWIAIAMVLMIGIFIPAFIMSVTMYAPAATAKAEEISLIVRTSVAYLCGLFSWLLLCSTMGAVRISRNSDA